MLHEYKALPTPCELLYNSFACCIAMCDVRIGGEVEVVVAASVVLYNIGVLLLAR